MLKFELLKHCIIKCAFRNRLALLETYSTSGLYTAVSLASTAHVWACELCLHFFPHKLQHVDTTAQGKEQVLFTKNTHLNIY